MGVSNLTDDGDYLETGNLIAGTPKVHAELERMLRPKLRKGQRQS